jgi:hypothetical protein
MPLLMPVIGAGLRGLAELSRFRLVAVVVLSVIGAGVGRVTRQSMGVRALALVFGPVHCLTARQIQALLPQRT